MRQERTVQHAPDVQGRSVLQLRFPATQGAVRQTLIDNEAALRTAINHVETCNIAHIALAEALNNVVEHAYAAQQVGDIDIDVFKGDSGVRFEIRDQGRPMPHGTLPAGRMPDVDLTDVPSLPEGGFGWALLRQLTTRVSYRRDGDENLLCFEIDYNSSPQTDL